MVEHEKKKSYLISFRDSVNETGINVDQPEKKHAVFPAKFSLFFWKKMRVRPQKNFGWKNEKKRGPKKNVFFAPENVGGSPTSNIIVGSFDIIHHINIDAPRVWGMSGHYTPATAGRFFKKCQKIGPGAYFPRQNVAPCGFNKFFFYRK